MTCPYTGSPPPPQDPWEVAYTPLLAIARKWQRWAINPDQLDPEALVHETWLRLSRQELRQQLLEERLLEVATREMKRVRVDHLRAVRAAKRGGGTRHEELQDVAIEPAPDRSVLRWRSRLEQHSARWGLIVEMRFERGLTVPEVAEELNLSITTIEKECRRLRSWLARELEVA